MRTLSEKQQKQHQKQMASLEKMRWWLTFTFLFDSLLNIVTLYEKRSQFASLFSPLSSSGFPIWHHLWVNIYLVIIGPILVFVWWVRIHNYRREQLAAEQEALQKAATPPDGVWPPPPQS